MLHTYKVLALVIYRDERKLVTTNMVRAKDKKEAKKQIEKNTSDCLKLQKLS